MKSKNPPETIFHSPIARTLLLLLAALVVYWPSLHGPLLLDDDLWVGTLFSKTTAGLWNIWRGAKLPDYFPLTSTSFWIEWHLWGANTFGYHVVNLVLHALSGVILWRILVRLELPGAWLAAMLFVVHPVNVESVAWISQRKNTLCLFFYLLSILWWLRSAQKINRAWFLSLIFFALALLSKTAVVTLPFVLLLCLWWQHGQIRWADSRKILPYFILALAFGLITAKLQSSRAIGADVVYTGNFFSRLANAGQAFWFYLAKAVFPIHLIFSYPRWTIDPHSPLAYLPSLACFIGAGALWIYRKRANVRAVIFSLGYFGLLLLPVLGFIDIYYFRYSMVADHWQYFAIAGVIVLLVSGATVLIPKWPGIFLAVIVTLIFSGLSFKQSKLYGQPNDLWRATLDRNPTSWLAHNMLGFSLQSAGKTDEAAVHFHESLRLNPNQVEPHLNLGSIALNARQPEQAEAEYELARKIAPNTISLWFDVGVAYDMQNRTVEAESAYRTAIQLDPDYALAHINLGNILDKRGLKTEAIAEFREAARSNPSLAGAHNNIALILTHQGQKAEAEKEFHLALELDPKNPETHNSLGKMLAEQNKFAEAIQEFREAVRLQPAHAVGQANLGTALFLQGSRDEALTHLMTALQLQPDLAEAHYYAASILFAKKSPLEEVLPHWREAVRLKPEWAGPKNDLAWVLATHPEAKFRDGEEALRLASRAVELTETNNPVMLDTLGAAYAEAGHWTEAMEAATRALAIKPMPPALAAQIQDRLTAYRNHRPFRDASR